MSDNTSSDFDFDDWAGLYIENPEEFEARRQTTLMIELMQGSGQDSDCAGARAMLDAYEAAAQGCTPEQRMLLSQRMMMESAHQLSAELQLLRQALQTQCTDSQT